MFDLIYRPMVNLQASCWPAVHRAIVSMAQSYTLGLSIAVSGRSLDGLVAATDLGQPSTWDDC